MILGFPFIERSNANGIIVGINRVRVRKMIRVLQLTQDTAVMNGRMQVVMNIYRKIDKTKIQFDFLVTDAPKSEPTFDEEIKKLGGVVYKTENNLRSMRKMIKQTLTNVDYHIVDYHATSKWLLVLNELSSFADTRLVIHAHNSALGNNNLTSFRNKILTKIFYRYGDCFAAVSTLAGKGSLGRDDFHVVPNGVESEKYKFDAHLREKIREEFDIESERVAVLNVARLSEEKNQSFLIDVLSIIGNENVHLYLIGDGPVKQTLENRAKSLGVTNRVHFLGLQSEVHELYSAFDLFVLPSFVEGLPTVALEAAANGLPMLISNRVTNEVNIGLAKFISIDRGHEKEWASAIVDADLIRQKVDQDAFNRSRFTMNNAVQKWMDLYSSVSR